MAHVVESVASVGADVSFELDRFEFDSDGHIEMAGRWFGVRGRRFVRPTLTLQTETGMYRLLADLEHKPWAAQDGELWTAAFPWDADPVTVDEMELAVAPDIAVELSRSGRKSSPGRKRTAAKPTPRLRSVREDGQALRDALASAAAENGRLRAELEQMEALKVEMSSALARRDAAVEKLKAVERKREQAERLLAEARSERDKAIRALGEAVRHREEVRDAVATQPPAAAAPPLPPVAVRPSVSRPQPTPPAPQAPEWLPRALALVGLGVAALVLLVIIFSG